MEQEVVVMEETANYRRSLKAVRLIEAWRVVCTSIS